MLNVEQLSKLDWFKTAGMIPVIVQHNVSGEVLMHGYMNEEALQKTIVEKRITFFSRTKNRLWTKGETSGYFLDVKSITSDCDNDALLIMVDLIGPTCHLGMSSCFSPVTPQLAFLYQLELLLIKRKEANPFQSYTSKLYASGTKRIAQKVAEEAIETSLAATVHNRQELINEASDLLYHLLVLLQDQSIDFITIINNLYKRHNIK